jgi:glycerol kinase
MESVEIATLREGIDRVEHDAEELICSIEQALNGVVTNLDGDSKSIKCIGLATQRSSIVCWDRITGEALSPVISWQDRRTASLIHEYSDQAEQIHKLTGLMLSPHYGATKMKWCLDNLSDVKQAFQDQRLACGSLSSFISFRLVNDHPYVVDPCNASRTLLWNFRTQKWDQKLLSLFDIPMEVLPQCVANHYEYGAINLGTHEVPLTVVSGDQSSALYALAEPQLDTTYINMGTGAFLQRPLGNKPIEANTLLSSLVWQSDAGSSFVLEGTVNGAGSALNEFADEKGMSKEDLYHSIERGIKSVTEPPLYLNGISGLGSLFWIADFPSCFVGAGNQDEKLIAVIESIVFLINANLEKMNSLVGLSARLIVTGGLSTVNGLCQKLSDLSGVPIERPQIVEATAHGMAYLLGAMSHISPSVTSFKPASNHLLQQRYKNWLSELKSRFE